MELLINKLAGQEGLEPPTCGFGDRRSTNWSYWPISVSESLASFLVQGMSTTPLAILLELNTIGDYSACSSWSYSFDACIQCMQGDQSTHQFSFKLRISIA